MPEQKRHFHIWLLYIFAWIVIHYFMRCNYLDDLAAVKTYFRFNGNILSATTHSYCAWDPRFLIHIIFMFFIGKPWWLWKIFDVSFLCLILYSLHAICNDKQNESIFFYTSLLVFCYPFCHQGSTGWIATTTNHLWTVSLCLYCSAVILSVLRGEVINRITYFTFFVAALYATNIVIIDAILILLFTGILVLLRYKKRQLLPPPLTI